MNKLEKYVCIWKDTTKTRNCETCCGITNICGMYENKLKIDIFKEYFKRKEKGGHVRSGENPLQGFCEGCNSLTVH